MTLSLAAVLAEPAWRRPDKTAVIQGTERLSYSELWAQSRGQAAAIRELGLRPGDRVALMSPNVIDFPRTYFAILAAGAVVVPIHMLLTPDEIAYILRNSGARLLIAHAVRAEDAVKAAAQAEVPVRLVGPVPEEAPLPKLADEVAKVEPLTTYVSRQPEDPAVVIYTSGTTGKPKGAVLTNLNMVMNAMVNGYDALNTAKDDIALGCLPLFHIFGQTVSMNTIFRIGATVVFQPRFEPDEAIDLILEHQVNSFHGVPQMYLALVQAGRARRAAGRPLPKLKLAVSGGAALPAAVLEAFNETFDADILEGYGLSETSPVVTVNQPPLGTRAGTIGHAIWGVEVEIARAEVEGVIEFVPRGELGEIVVRGHNVFAGYLDNPEATAAAMVDDWFRTGDLGTKSEDGFVTVVDRKKDMVIRGGYNVYPREIEESLLRHPAIRDVAVIGLADEVHGEEICACVILNDGATLTADELIEWSQERLAKYKYPRRVEFVTEFPLGPSMKVLKRELRDRFAH
ncbi:long-chain fatty acid--CoA ligase [Actinospica sp.]|jgi:long-chain acyl-CoA synthetase|uniref:long-chain-fatty-acid--CoA ligase n=1 Tax=Actinospica sp. TaxID=1872142 RepID=UPI002C1152D5|nr:long-chain fatty acid--CoA ligase [Actinospica sp.]HWG28447.1 long-chain fatty acid--CoA ligase [Actinospica sp.]